MSFPVLDEFVDFLEARLYGKFLKNEAMFAEELHGF